VSRSGPRLTRTCHVVEGAQIDYKAICHMCGRKGGWAVGPTYTQDSDFVYTKVVEALTCSHGVLGSGSGGSICVVVVVLSPGGVYIGLTLTLILAELARTRKRGLKGGTLKLL